MYDLLSLSLSEKRNAESGLPFENKTQKSNSASGIVLAKVTVTPNCIMVETRCDKETVTQTDTAFIEQVLLNIIDSAIEYRRANKRIHLSIQKVKNELLIKVSDNSCQVEKEKLNRLFNRLEDAGKNRCRGLGGTKISSTIVRHISQVHGGYITADSKTNGRDRFTIHPSLSDYDPGQND